eukprot:1176054-Prorocentrum_minimum.AAC.5
MNTSRMLVVGCSSRSTPPAGAQFGRPLGTRNSGGRSGHAIRAAARDTTRAATGADRRVLRHAAEVIAPRPWNLCQSVICGWRPGCRNKRARDRTIRTRFRYVQI